MLTGNKGEWSEFYTLIKLLLDKKVHAANEDLSPVESLYFPILEITRQENHLKTNYDIRENDVIKLRIGERGTYTINVTNLNLTEAVVNIFQKIKQAQGSTFEIPIANDLIEVLHYEKLSAASNKKTDIVLMIHDIRTGLEPEIGFSIKSKIGKPAHLLNASGATNFIYEIQGLPDNFDIASVNNPSDEPSVSDQINFIREMGGVFLFDRVQSEIFQDNLLKIDSLLPTMLAELLLKKYSSGNSRLTDLLNDLTVSNATCPMPRVIDSDFYKYKIKNLLLAAALGMRPATYWNGLFEVQGGYLIVKEDGEIACYHLYNQEAFREYLFQNTKLEMGERRKHKFAKLYRDSDKYFYKLNLAIRFI